MSANPPFNTNEFRAAIERRDATSLADQLMAHSFVLIHLKEEDESSDVLGALTADFENVPHLVAFTSQKRATDFVELRADLFGDDEVGGFLVDGEMLLDYIAEDYGLLLNPDSVAMCRVDAKLVAHVWDALDLE